MSIKYFSVCKIYLDNEVSQTLENAAEELTWGQESHDCI